jgi:hypothetical protein
MWRTPDAPKAGGVRTHTGSQGSGHQMTIAEQAECWQTPATDSFRSRGGVRKDEMGLDQQARFWTMPQSQELLWYTPHGLAGGPTGHGGGEFAEQATKWEPSRQVPAIRYGLTFWPRVRILLRLCRLLRLRLPSPYNKAKSIFRRKLNPHFVDWLMGWPVGWSSVDHAYSATETESYLCRQRQFLAFLLKGSV